MRSDATAPSEVGRWRAILYSGAACARVLIAIAAVVLLAMPILIAGAASERGAATIGGLIVAGLALLGIGLPLISIALARMDWSATAALLDRPLGSYQSVSLIRPRTLIRPLAHTVIMITLGGAIAVLTALIVIGSLVAMISPLLTAIGDQAVIGPFTVQTMPQSIAAACTGVILLVGVILTAPTVARAHAAEVLHVLTHPEQRLQRDLMVTAQSRARLVRAFDIERRRIERDLHDGVQPQLLSVSMTLGMALAALPEGAPGRGDVIRAQQQAREALDSLRHFVHNIHPQVLIDHGLGAAIGEIADTLTVPITIDDGLSGRLSSEIETNLYFCVAELIANVVKHSEADRARVEFKELQDDVVTATVEDNGRGGAGALLEDGGGLHGVADRIAALDGDMAIDSPLGGPTRITITLAEPGREHADA